MAAATSAASESCLRFGVFDVDLDGWQLRKSGVRVKLQRKPFQILRILLQRRGELVTRAELARILWPGLHVEFERSLNTAINCLRQALGDTPRSCRYIETCPGLGYRFIGSVERIEGAKETRPPRPIQLAAASSSAEMDCRKALFFFDKMTPDGVARARAYFESALRTDPGHASAHAGLAHIQTMLAAWSLVPTAMAADEALLHAANALAANPQSAEAHVALANAYWLKRKPWVVVEAEYVRALAIDQDCFSAHVWYGALLSACARHGDARQQFEAAQNSDSLSLLLNYHAAWSLYAARSYHACIEQSWNALVLDCGFAPAQYTLGLAYEQLGMVEDAITELGNARRCSNCHPATLAGLAHALSKAGLDASGIVAELHAPQENGYCSRYWVAIAAMGGNDHDAALNELEAAGRAGDCLIDWIGVEPRFDPLRNSPRFQKWLRLI